MHIALLLRAAERDQRTLEERDRKTIANVDRFLGGTWWQESFRAVVGEGDLITATEVALKVAQRYRATLAAEMGFQSISMPVRTEAEQQPKYVLVLFTRHPAGVWEFASAVGMAGRDWQQALHSAERAREQAAQDRLGIDPLFDIAPEPFDPEAYEHNHRPVWTRGLAENIRHLLAEHGDFRLSDRTVQVYGPLLGRAWERHIRQAVKDLYPSTARVRSQTTASTTSNSARWDLSHSPRSGRHRGP